MEDVKIEVKIKARVSDIQSALRRISGNFSYIINGDTGLYAAIDSLLNRGSQERIFSEWLAKSEGTENTFENRNVEIVLRFGDPERGWQAAKKLERLVLSN
ncbi:MAG TPA: hypothetical protein VE978_18665 [Chitinophagales bacterium]|nr:hypothetical protein [Chitinophagales bacterium]